MVARRFEHPQWTLGIHNKFNFTSTLLRVAFE